MSYTHLTCEERYLVFALKIVGLSNRGIAKLLRRSVSTIGRELRRNRTWRGYVASAAHRLARERRQIPRRSPISSALHAFMREKLREQWSPEQISGYLRRHGGPTVSHERIYQEVYADARSGGTLWRHLRGARRWRRRRCPGRKRQGLLRERRLIDARPAIVTERVRQGDWEGDLIVSPSGGSTHLVSTVDRVSKYLLLDRVQSSRADAVTAVLARQFEAVPAALRHTLTLDNGSEFARHRQLAEQTALDIYFAHPYRPWERGTNENTNRLIRQYFPKGTHFSTVTDEQVQMVMDRLNHRPRKSLNYATPAECFAKGIGNAPLPPH